MEVPTRFQMFAEIVTFFRSVALGVGGFFLAVSAIFIMTTLGKIIADSRKEIGVFRAVGAQKRDVRKIYFGYAWLLVTGGYVIGFVVAIILDMIASWKWGENLFYQMMNAAVVTDVSQPVFLFLHITPLYMLGLYAGMMIVGVLASALPIRRASKIDPIKVLKDI
jgi:ABC-type antimicrobial peptide transport system permease subunit